MGEQGGVPPEETEPRALSENQENGTKEPEERDGLSDGSLNTHTSIHTHRQWRYFGQRDE